MKTTKYHNSYTTKGVFGFSILRSKSGKILYPPSDIYSMTNSVKQEKFASTRELIIMCLV